MSGDGVAFSISKESLLDILRRAAGQERTVIEFRTRDTETGRELHQAIEITDHVEALEEQTND